MIKNDWVVWNGNGDPPKDVYVQYQFRNETRLKAEQGLYQDANDLDWCWSDSDVDIIAYRPRPRYEYADLYLKIDPITKQLVTTSDFKDPWVTHFISIPLEWVKNNLVIVEDDCDCIQKLKK